MIEFVGIPTCTNKPCHNMHTSAHTVSHARINTQTHTQNTRAYTQTCTHMLWLSRRQIAITFSKQTNKLHTPHQPHLPNFHEVHSMLSHHMICNKTKHNNQNEALVYVKHRMMCIGDLAHLQGMTKGASVRPRNRTSKNLMIHPMPIRRYSKY